MLSAEVNDMTVQLRGNRRHLGLARFCLVNEALSVRHQR